MFLAKRSSSIARSASQPDLICALPSLPALVNPCPFATLPSIAWPYDSCELAAPNELRTAVRDCSKSGNRKTVLARECFTFFCGCAIHAASLAAHGSMRTASRSGPQAFRANLTLAGHTSTWTQKCQVSDSRDFSKAERPKAWDSDPQHQKIGAAPDVAD